MDNVDLRRYAGKWYEIARYPNRFQRNCQSDTTAIYTLRDDGKVQVVNACRERNGKVTTARGTAKVVDKKTKAKLKVTFFWPFYGDYWIIGLSPDYQYAIVGEPSRKYLWILSRTPSMEETTYQTVLSLVEALGYQREKLQKTNQTVGQLRRGNLLSVTAGLFVPNDYILPCEFDWSAVSVNPRPNLSHLGASLLTVFDGNGAVESQITRTVNLGHAAGTNRGGELVAGQRAAYHLDVP